MPPEPAPICVELTLYEDDVCALIRGEVPARVQNLLIGCLVDMASTPTDLHNKRVQRKRKARTEAA